MPQHFTAGPQQTSIRGGQTVGQILREKVLPLEATEEEIDRIIDLSPMGAGAVFGKKSAAVVENLFQSIKLPNIRFVASALDIVKEFQGALTQLIPFTKARGSKFLDQLRSNLDFIINKKATGEEFLAVLNELDKVDSKALDIIEELSGSKLRQATKSLFTSSDEAAMEALKAIGTKPLTAAQKKAAQRLGDFVTGGSRKPFGQKN